MDDRRPGGQAPSLSGQLSAARWVGRSFAAMTGALLGMALAHGFAWQATDPLPRDAEAYEIAHQFLVGQPGALTREPGGWTADPAGWSGTLLGQTGHRDGVILIRFKADSYDPAILYQHAAQVAETLHRAGWQDIHLDPHYPVVQATRDGLVVRSGPELADPSPPTYPEVEPEQAVLGLVVDIRRDTPVGEALALTLGALLGAGLALSGVVLGQRRLRHSRGPRPHVPALFTVGLVALAPGSLLTLGLLYLHHTDDLPHEPLWIAYSLPLTRPLTLIGLGLLLAAIIATALPSHRTFAGNRA